MHWILIIFVGIFIGIFILGIGSFIVINKNKKLTIKEIKQEANIYYKRKYGETLNIENIGTINIEGLISKKTDDIYINSTDKTTIIYIEEKNKFYDDKQSDEINEKIENELSAKLNSAIVNTEAEEVILKDIKFNKYNVETDRDLSASFYSNNYNGNIEEFLKIETVKINEVKIFVICENVNISKQQCRTIKDKIINEISDCGIYYKESSIELRILSKDCYDKYVNQEYRLPDIDMKGCYAKYQLGKNENEYISSYIKVLEGVYITSAEKNFCLEPGDIIFKESVSEEELIEEINNQRKTDDEVYVVKSDSCIYKVEFSKRVKEFLKKKTYSELRVYVRYDLDEAKSILYDMQDKEKSNKNIKLYYYREEYRNKCYDLYSDMSDGEYGVLKEGDYIFFGVQEKE